MDKLLNHKRPLHGATEMPQWTKGLLGETNNLSSSPRTTAGENYLQKLSSDLHTQHGTCNHVCTHTDQIINQIKAVK